MESKSLAVDRAEDLTEYNHAIEAFKTKTLESAQAMRTRDDEYRERGGESPDVRVEQGDAERERLGSIHEE